MRDIRLIGQRGILVLLFGVSAASRAGGQETGAALRLTEALPDLFPPGSLVEAAEMGLAGARVASPTAPQLELGLQKDDVIVAVEGVGLALDTWTPRTFPSPPTLTVLRRLAGARPVLEPEVVARGILDQFVELPTSEMTPMRLARMLANQQTLVTDGIGVVLVPSASNVDDAAWLRVANPLPEFSEEALRDVHKAVRGRVRLPFVEGSEADAADDAFSRRRYAEARERSSRALVEAAADPEARSQAASLQPLAHIYSVSSLEVAREREELLAPGARWALLLEGAYQRVEASPPQNTLFDVDDADGPNFAVGVSMGLFLPTRTGGPPILRDLHLMVEYGLSGRDFEGGTQTDPDRRDPRIETTLHRVSFELGYRPRVLSRLKPTLRGGVAVFPLSVRVFDDDLQLRQTLQMTEVGWIVGGGLDLYKHEPSGVRVAFMALVQRVQYTFCPEEAPGWESASNILDQSAFSRPRSSRCEPDQPGATQGPIYILDMNGWQLGLMLAWEF